MRLSSFLNKLIADKYLKKSQLAPFLDFQYPNLTLQFAGFINELCYQLNSVQAPFVKSAAFELTNHCNLRCSICPNSRGEAREKGYMDFDLFQEAVEANSGLNLVQLNGWGEPFMHPSIMEFIAFAKSKGKRVYLYSNGTMIEGELAERILRSGLDRIVVSIDGIGETYEQVRGYSYTDIENRVLSLVKKRDQTKSPLMVDVSMVASRETQGEVPAFIERWKGRVDRVQILSYLEHRYSQRTNRCRELWRGNPQVLWDGKVTVCCVDWSGELVFAQLGPDGYDLKEIWNCEKIKELRRQHMANDFRGLCTNCAEYSSEYTVNRFGG